MCIDCLCDTLPVYTFDVIVDYPGDTLVITIPALCKVHAVAKVVATGVPRELIIGAVLWPLPVEFLAEHIPIINRATEH